MRAAVGDPARFFDLSLDLLATVDVNGYITLANGAWEQVFGWTREELMAVPYVEFIHPEDQERTLQEARRIAEQATETREFELRFRQRSGAYRWLSFNVRAFPQEQVLYCYGRDITERRLGEARVRDSELRLRSVTDSVSDALISADQEGKITFWNPGASRMFGYSPEEVLGRPLTVLMPERYRTRHLEGLARFDATGEAHVIGGSIDVHGLRRDGREFPLELSLGEWKLSQGTVYTGVLRDVTQRQRADRYLATQLAVAQVLAEDLELPKARLKLLAAIGGSMGWKVGELWRLDDEELVMRSMAIWEDAVETHPGFTSVTRDSTFVRGVGLPGQVWEQAAPVWIDDVASADNFPRGPLADREGLHSAIGIPLFQEGRVVGAMNFFSGTIERPDEELHGMMTALGAQLGEYFTRRRAERELAETAAELSRRAVELERSNADLEQFAYVASHDLSEPLRMVGGFVSLIARRYQGQLDDSADEFIQYAVDGVTRMQALIDDLLAYSRVGRAGANREPVDCAKLLARVRVSLATQIAESGGQVVLGELPTVVGDPTQLGQLFQNLISNALKFRGSEPPVVEVGAEREETAWRFTVRDNGIGIAPQYADRIFKVFQRLHGREEYPGTGIGLAICQRIVERHGGRIWFEPAGAGGTASGTAFHFTLADGGGIEG